MANTNTQPTLDEMTFACGTQGDHEQCKKHRLKVMGLYPCKCPCHAKKQAAPQPKPVEQVPAVNWNVHTIWDARDKQVRLYSGTLAMVRLYGDGWAIGSIEGMDIWGACAFLNNMRAYIDN